MSAWILRVICMTCDDTITASGDDGDAVERELDADAARRGWIQLPKRPGRMTTYTVCDACAREIVSAVMR